MRNLVIVFMLAFSLTAAIALPMYAQHKAKPDAGGLCWECDYPSSPEFACAICTGYPKSGMPYQGYEYNFGSQTCVSHSPACEGAQGPPWCETTGMCWYCAGIQYHYSDCVDAGLAFDEPAAAEANRSADGIVAYFRKSGVLSADDINDLTATVEAAARGHIAIDAAKIRYDAYRDVFNKVMGANLTYGSMPVYPKGAPSPWPSGPSGARIQQ